MSDYKPNCTKEDRVEMSLPLYDELREKIRSLEKENTRVKENLRCAESVLHQLKFFPEYVSAIEGDITVNEEPFLSRNARRVTITYELNEEKVSQINNRNGWC